MATPRKEQRAVAANAVSGDKENPGASQVGHSGFIGQGKKSSDDSRTLSCQSMRGEGCVDQAGAGRAAAHFGKGLGSEAPNYYESASQERNYRNDCFHHASAPQFPWRLPSPPQPSEPIV